MAVWDNFTNQSQWETYLKNLIRTNKKALLKSIVVIYDNQTCEEKVVGASFGKNKIGFNRWDAEKMTSFAEKIKRGKQLEQNEVTYARIVMPKYWKQLMVISKQKLKDKKEFDEAFAEVQGIQGIIEEKAEFLDEMHENVRKCVEEGKSCSYGICSECPILNNLS